MFSLKMMEMFFKAGAKGLVWTAKHPDTILQIWLLAWGLLIYSMFLSQGMIEAVQFTMTSMFNMGSIFGLPIPIFALIVSLLTSLGKYIKKWVIDGILTLVNVIKKRIMEVGSKIKAAAQKVKKAFKKLKAAESDMYLGLDVDWADKKDEFVRATDEFMYLLALEGY